MEKKYLQKMESLENKLRQFEEDRVSFKKQENNKVENVTTKSEFNEKDLEDKLRKEVMNNGEKGIL